MTERYWVRLKDHLNEERVMSLVAVLSSHALRLAQGPTDQEYVIDLMPRKKTEAFERSMNVWVRAGFIDWRKLDDNSNP